MKANTSSLNFLSASLQWCKNPGPGKQMVALPTQKPAIAKGSIISDLPTCGFSLLFLQEMPAQPGLQSIRNMAASETNYLQLNTPT
jgi:hypothetical protein